MSCKCGTPGCAGPADKGFIDRCIAQDGWAGMGVMAGEGSPGFNYTIGLTGMGRPELIVLGLPSRVAHAILADAVARIDEIRDGAVLEGIATFPSAFLSVPKGPANEGFLIQARHYYGSEVEALQMVWPDPRGLFPWQPGCDARMAAMQAGLLDFANAPAIPGALAASAAAPRGLLLH